MAYETPSTVKSSSVWTWSLRQGRSMRCGSAPNASYRLLSTADFPNPFPACRTVASELKFKLNARLSCWDNRQRRENRSMRTAGFLHAGQQSAQANDVRSVHLIASNDSTNIAPSLCSYPVGTHF